MTDPFDALREPEDPIRPDPAFAAALRRRVERALNPAEDSVDASNLFYFTLPSPDADRSERFYRELFGWEMNRSDAGWHITSTAQAGGINADTHAGAATVFLRVDDMDAALAGVRAHGGTATEPVEYDSGLTAECTDARGVRFSLSVPSAEYDGPPAYGDRHGDLFYFSLPAADPDASRQLYGAVLGWEFDDFVGEQGGVHVSNMVTEGGLGGGSDGVDPELYFRVDDLEAARDRVVALGGEILSDVMGGDEGRHLWCADDQGATFGLSEPAPGY